MKQIPRFVYLLIISLNGFSLQGFSQNYPPLTIEAGQSVTLPPKLYIYSEINIKKNGSLIIEANSASWCILYCKGNVKINGNIIFKNFKSGKKKMYQALTPDGQTLSHNYTEEAVGGSGGDGGVSASSYRGCFEVYALGGTGAAGGSNFGGGGGAGGLNRTCSQSCQCQVAKGHDALGRKGGIVTPLYYSSRGGDGAQNTNTFMNGGLLYINCDGDFDGTGGYIDASGTEGSNGEFGIATLDPRPNGNNGGGGGGGGAPGGEGGAVILKLKRNATAYPEINVTGGKGGQGGTGGQGFHSVPQIPPSKGTNGTAGDNGDNGIFEVRKGT